MLDLSTSSPSSTIPSTTADSNSDEIKCDKTKISEPPKTDLDKFEPERSFEKLSTDVSSSDIHSNSVKSLISFALLNTSSVNIHPTKPKLSVATARHNMNEKDLQPPLSPSKMIGMALPASNPLPTSSSSPSSLKLLPKKFSPFSVDSLLSHKEKQAACEDTDDDIEGTKDTLDSKPFHTKTSQKIKEHLLHGASSRIPSDLNPHGLPHDPMGVNHHLSVAKFLLNNNFHDRNNADSINNSRLHCLNGREDKLDLQEHMKIENLPTKARDSSNLKRFIEKKEPADFHRENNGSSKERDIDVCGDDADMEDDEAEYHDDMNDIKSEGNYQSMMSDDDISADEDNEDIVKSEEIEDEKQELERQLQLHHLASRSSMSPKQGQLLSPRFPLGFPITSSSPNPFSPPSPASALAGSSLPRPTPSLPWMPQLRSPLQMPGFIGRKCYIISIS